MLRHAFRLLTSEEFSTFASTGVFEGSDKDVEAGFIHLSTIDQLERRIHRYIDEDGSIYALCVNLELVKDDVRWEIANDGDAYPHLFRPITRAFATEANLDQLQVISSG